MFHILNKNDTFKFHGDWGKHCKCKNNVEKIKNINRLQLVRI